MRDWVVAILGQAVTITIAIIMAVLIVQLVLCDGARYARRRSIASPTRRIFCTISGTS